MIRFIYDADQDIAEFVASRMPNMSRGFGPAIKAIGVINERNEFLGGVVYHNWTPEAGTIGMSLASTTARWLARPVLQRIIDFPFHECGCQMIMSQIRASDHRLQRILSVIGFSFTPAVRLYGRNEDGIHANLTDDDWAACRFNRNRFATELEEAA